jgi:hypothetical protein
MGFGSSLAVKIIGIVIVLFLIMWVLNSLLGGVKDFVQMLNPVNWFKDGGVFKPVGNLFSSGAGAIAGAGRKTGSAIAGAGRKTGSAIAGGANSVVDGVGSLFQDEEDLDGNVL